MVARSVFGSLVTVLLGAVLGCSSSGAASGGSGGGSGGDGGGSGGSSSGVDSGSGGCPGGAPVCIDTPAQGFVLESVGTTIGAGEDVQYCEVVQLPGTPGEPIFVSGIDGRMTAFSHHLNVMAVLPGSAADAATTPGQRVPCLNNGRVPFGSGLRQIFGAVSPENSLVLPDGVGHRLDGGQKLVFNYHYFNTSTEAVPAKAALAFHVTDASNVRRELRRFGMYNTGFVVPAGTQGAFTAECTMAEDVEILSMLRHTHRWGKDFQVWRAGGAGDGTPVFESTDWEEDIVYAPTAPLLVKQGEGLRFRCAFDNTTDHDLTFGELATDEMCILYGNLVATRDGLPLPEDCAIVTSTQDQTAKGFPCAQCPDGE